MQFFTKVPIPFSEHPVSYESKLISIGSCFAVNMGEKFHYYQFQNTTNPFGIIFNPISVEKVIRRTVRKEFFTDKDLFFHNERWHCFEVHSDLSHPEKEYILQMLNDTLIQIYNQLSSATHVIITLGTAWVYKHNQTQEIVANCHKIPQKEFLKQLLSNEEIMQSLENMVDLVSEINPNCSYIFSISPVRHIKDGFVENQVSKSHLVASVYAFIQNSKIGNRLVYFPSYEIMMDELRDYRFYSSDLLHPNGTAIDYIWSRFMETTIEKSAYATMDEVAIIQKSLQHRAFNPDSISHQKFLVNLKEKMDIVQSKYPFMNF